MPITGLTGLRKAGATDTQRDLPLVRFVLTGFGFSRQMVAAQIKEIAQDNEPMAGLMHKHGGVIGDSRVLELKTGLTPDMTRRFGANVEMLHLPGDYSGKKSGPNNFLIRWFDGEHEVVGIYTRTISTFTGDPIVRLQLTSNGILPDNEMLKEVLASIMTAGRDIISERG